MANFYDELERWSNMRRTEFAIIGAGPGGYVAALRAAQLGAKVILIEKQWLGGVCLNVGCIPTKALLKSAEMFTLIGRASDYGVKTGQPSIDWKGIQARKTKVVSQLVGGVSMLLERAGVEVLFGEARFTGRDTLEVKSKEGLESIVADHIIVATGSRAATLPVPGIHSPRVIDSTGALALQELPESILVIGGGAIGLEWASMFVDFGCNVTLVEILPRLAPLMDQDLGDALAFNLKQRGVKVMTYSSVDRIDSGEDGCCVIIQTPSGQTTIETELVLSAVGRLPNVESFDLGKARVAYSQKGIEVDRRMRASTAGIYAIGDVAVEGPMLAHVASHQGVVAVENACGHNTFMDYTAVPNCIFTNPEAASVGLTEEEAAFKGYNLKVGKFGLANNGKAIANGETEGFVKIISDAVDGTILGIHIFGLHASDLILEGTLSIRLDATLDEIEAAIHPHPTLGEAIHEAVLSASGRAFHLPKS
jgi:dihydrolipoamide dehydrogenase